jgi:outer membrane protein assembly factor BamB
MASRSIARSFPRLGVLLLAASLLSCSDAPREQSSSTANGEWRELGGNLSRTYFNPDETAINRDTARRLVPRWRFLTGAVVTSSPIVADVTLPDRGKTKLVFASSWDGNLYALTARDGELVWSYAYKPHPGASYPQASSPTVADVGGNRLVVVGSGMTIYALDAATGTLVWQFDAGTGCTDCDFLTERNEILSSPAVYRDVVYFGMDINDFGTGKGGFYALDARSGDLRWYFDLETSSTCTPRDGDHVHRFDGYHSADELGLPQDFFASRAGCGFDRTGTACGNVWSSATIDEQRGLIYTASSNCDTDTDPTTPPPLPPMPPYDEALFALHLDGTPAWVWRPREVDNDDLAFGGVPNLFEIELAGKTRQVVGVGNKDGTYYVLDRDGVNQLTGRIEPYWQRKVVPGGDIGGVIASASVAEGKVLFSTAIGTDIAALQRPAAHALNADDGSILWQNQTAFPSYAPTSAIPGVVFMGSISGSVVAYDSNTGEELIRLPLGGPVSSPSVVAGGRLFVGSGTGARGGSPAEVAFQTSLIPSPVVAFCVSGTEDCPEGGNCDDGNSCTTDERAADGTCSNAPLGDGIACKLGTFDGTCRDGLCSPLVAQCEDQNQCTKDIVDGQNCRHEPEADGKHCVVDDVAGQCESGTCVKLIGGDS